MNENMNMNMRSWLECTCVRAAFIHCFLRFLRRVADLLSHNYGVYERVNEEKKKIHYKNCKSIKYIVHTLR